MARKYAMYRRRPQDFIVLYDVIDDGGKYSADKRKEISARDAADAATMFDFWARGENAQWGCTIRPRELLLHVATYEEDHPKNEGGE